VENRGGNTPQTHRHPILTDTPDCMTPLAEWHPLTAWHPDSMTPLVKWQPSLNDNPGALIPFTQRCLWLNDTPGSMGPWLNVTNCSMASLIPRKLLSQTHPRLSGISVSQTPGLAEMLSYRHTSLHGYITQYFFINGLWFALHLAKKSLVATEEMLHVK
jgi:hypothetical protein